MKGMQLDLPDARYERLREISVDDLNLTRVLLMIREGMIPNLQSLNLTITRPITLALSWLGHLRHLSLENTSKDIHPLPELNELTLDSLSLSGYAMEFQGMLPRILKLQRCFVKDSCDLEGCNEMSLDNVLWETDGISPGSLPTTSLAIQCGKFTAPVPNTLKSLTLISTQVEEISLQEVTSFYYDDRSRSSEGYRDINLAPSRLETLSITLHRDDVVLPPTVQKLVVHGVVPLELPMHLVSLDLEELGFDQLQLFQQLPTSVRSLRVIRCSFLRDGDIVVPESLKKLEFIGCSEVRDVGVKMSDAMESLLVIGAMPRIRQSEDNRTVKYLQAKTNTLLMDLRQFRLFCISQLGKPTFETFEDCFQDILTGQGWKTPEELQEYTKIIIGYPYHLQRIASSSIMMRVFLNGNQNIKFKFDKSIFELRKLRMVVEASRRETTPLDQALESILNELGGKKRR
jgi:hypothetical protein